MYKMILLSSVLIVASSCGKKRSPAPKEQQVVIQKQSPSLARITKTVPNSNDGLHFKVFVKHRSSLNPFKNKKDFDLTLSKDGNVILGEDDSKVMGTHQCDEFLDKICAHRSIQIDIKDGPYTSKANIMVSLLKEEFTIMYREHKVAQIYNIKKRMPFAVTQSFMISTDSLSSKNLDAVDVKWVRVKNYFYNNLSKDLFFKTLIDEDDQEIIISSKLPVKSFKNNYISSGIGRDHFRRSYDDWRAPKLIESNIIYSASSYYSQTFSLFSNPNREIKLYMIGLY